MVSEYEKAVYEDYLMRELDKLLPFVYKWYSNYFEHVFEAVGSFTMRSMRHEGLMIYEDAPHILMYRFAATEWHSAIRGVQAFPFVSVANLDLPNVKGGIRSMVNEVLGDGFYEYGDMYMVLKHGLVHTDNARQFIAFVTKEFYAKLPRGSFLWLSENEFVALNGKICPDSLRGRANKWLANYDMIPTTLRSLKSIEDELYDIEDR